MCYNYHTLTDFLTHKLFYEIFYKIQYFKIFNNLKIQRNKKFEGIYNMAQMCEITNENTFVSLFTINYFKK